jgi:hypothetical protein
MKAIARKDFANGSVYALETDDGFPIEVTDTFLPYYTKDAVGANLKTQAFHLLKPRNIRLIILGWASHSLI